MWFAQWQSKIIASLFSDDLPRSALLRWGLMLVFLGLLLTPFLTSGARALNTAATICIYIVLVASYDLLLGYTGIVSFAHTLFFGLGAYGVGLSLTYAPASVLALFIGVLLALVCSLLLALVIGLFALRVRAIFYSMMTLAVASSFAVLCSQLSDITGGEDGMTFSVPDFLTAAFVWSEQTIWGRPLDGRLLSYYLVFITSTTLFFLLLRVVHSPFGRVLQAIRENEFRAEALGFRTVFYRIQANCIAALAATLAGALLAVWLRYVGPKTTLSFDVMTDILLIVVIGGMGTLYGAVIGSVLFLLLQNYLKNGMGQLAELLQDYPQLSQLVHPDRWMLWLGVVFIISVYFFPRGIVGRLQKSR